MITSHVKPVPGTIRPTYETGKISPVSGFCARRPWAVVTGLKSTGGLPPQVVSGGVCDAESAWRGAFLAHGSLTEPGRSSALEVTCPGPEAALALVGAARRLGVQAKAREVRGVDRVVIHWPSGTRQVLQHLAVNQLLTVTEPSR